MRIRQIFINHQFLNHDLSNALHAILFHDVTLLERELQAHPLLALRHDIDKKQLLAIKKHHINPHRRNIQKLTLLHVALQYGNKNIIAVLMQHIQKQFFIFAPKVLNLRNDQNRNLLHYAAQFASEERFFTFVNALPKDLLQILAEQVDKQGRLPVQYFIDNPYPIRKMKNFLLAQHRKYSVIGDLKTKFLCIENNFGQTTNSALHQNLARAQSAATVIRNTINESSSHPYTNDLSRSEQEDVGEKIYDLRQYHHALNKHVVTNNDAGCYQYLLNIKKAVRKYKAANCKEFAYLVYLHLIQQGYFAHRIVQIAGDDHVLNLIGLAPNFNLRDPKTWGDDAVLLDAWSGKAYALRDATKYLKCYVYHDHTSIVFPFDPNFHQIKIERFHVSESFMLAHNKKINQKRANSFFANSSVSTQLATTAMAHHPCKRPRVV